MTSITRPGVDLGLPERPRLGGLVRRIAHRFIRGRTEDAVWVRPAYLGVVGLAALLYLVNLTVSGYANTYYSAAALAASQSWSAWFFGSFDAANFITVDKPPLATMLMGLSVRVFGLSSWSILVPEALAGVATVALVFALVRRQFGPVAAVIAGLVTALTPAAVLIFRYNNPDALLTLLLVGSAWAFIRALESPRFRWVVLSGILVGLAFNTKYLQAYLVLPTFLLVYLIAARGRVWRRLAGLLIAAVTVLVASGWWVLAVDLIPAASRPFIGGSTTNSALELVFGYDGLARIFGAFGSAFGAAGGGAPGGGGANFSGTPGILRIFNAELGGQVGWLVPFALIGLVSGLALRGRAPRTDAKRAGYLLWGGWLITHVVVFSFMSGIIHSYYSVAMAPAIGALVGAGVVDLWALRRRHALGGLPLATAIGLGGAVAWQLLDRTPTFVPGLGLVVLAVSLLTALIVALPHNADRHAPQLLAVGLAMAMLLAGPGAYAVDTVLSAHSGGDPAAGPVATQGRGGFGGGPSFAGGAPGSGAVASAPDGEFTGTSSSLVSYLVANRGSATWIVAATSAQQAGSIELAAGEPVMAMGGFTGSDPAPTLTQFQALVASGQVRFVLVGGGGGFGGPGGGSATVSEINQWVASVGTAVDYGGSSGTLYDLSAVAPTLGSSTTAGAGASAGS